MSWIQENKFAAALAGGTVVAAGVLYFVGTLGADRYAAAQTRFEEAAAEAKKFEKVEPYPRDTNRDGKTKAIDDYRKAIEGMQATFQPFRPGEIKNTTGAAFTANLLASVKEIRAAFEESGATVPEPFFAGFERYRTTGASDNITGILSYQLDSVKKILLSLARSKPTELKNLYRPALAEEEGQTYNDATGVARRFPLEITFTGSEKSVREFFTALNKPDQKFAIIRTIRISSMKKDPPRASDAKFDPVKPANVPGAAFVIPGDVFALPEAPKAPDAAVAPGAPGAPAAPVVAGAPAAPAAPAAPPKPTGSTRILAQVLGTEELAVFVRLDVLQFLPVKKLP